MCYARCEHRGLRAERSPASEAGNATPLTQRPSPQVNPTRSTNLILASLPPDEYEHLRGLMEAHPLRMRETLQEAGEQAEYVYFPTSGIISLLTVLENGMMIEFATVGHEGTTGVPLFLGMGESNMAIISQVPGDALRMRADDFRSALATSPGFAQILTRYSGLMLALVAQSAACNRAHHMDARCARWLSRRGLL